MSAATPRAGLDRLDARQPCHHRDTKRTDSFHFMRLPAQLDFYQGAAETKRKFSGAVVAPERPKAAV
jgi:hypothetical protein